MENELGKLPTGEFGLPKGIKHIRRFKKLWQQYSLLKHAEDTFKNKLLNELVSECKINHSKFLLHKCGKQLLVRLDFETLQKYGLLLNHNSITKSLLSYLEPFPFDNEKLEKIKSNSLCIAKIRNVVEKQYLAWKYQVDEKELEQVLFRFKFCLYPFRSIRNLRRSISLLESGSEGVERNIAETIYLINQKPFSQETVENFNEKVVGVKWHMFPYHCFKILRHSHEYILFIVSVLKKAKFTDTQIRAGLPLLHLPFITVIFRLNRLLENPELSKYRNEEFFLYLLHFNSMELLKLVNVSFTELLEIIRISLKQGTKVLTLNVIRQIVSQFYEIKSSYFDLIPRHSRYRHISESQIYDTLRFLQENKFTSNEVSESITIIFYPRDLIVKAMQKMKENQSTLKKFGFRNGCVFDETNCFVTGTKEKRKTLQLCLYYIEKLNILEDETAEVDSNATKGGLVTLEGNANLSQ